MNARHLIETLDFDFACAGPQPDLDDDEALARLLRDVLLPVVEQTLAACDEPGTVLVLPALDIDLGTLPRADFRAEAGRRLRSALLDALDGARRCAAGTALHGGDAAGAATLHVVTERDLAQLAGFLATGRLPWHAGVAGHTAHIALLDRLLAGAPARLPPLLAAALAQPDGARRLAAQFPARQLEALLRLTAGGVPDTAARPLDACASSALLRARLAQPSGAATGHAEPAAALAAFLHSGRLDATGAGARGMDDDGLAPHVRLLERALAGPVAALQAVVRRALAHAASARRLVDQYSPEQLAALARRCAPRRAVALLAQLASDAPALAWRRVLAACLEGDEGTDALPAVGDDLARLTAFLSGSAPLPGAEAVLARAIAAAATDRGRALRLVLAQAGVDAAAERLAQRLPGALLVRLAERLAPAPARAAAAWAHDTLAGAAAMGAGTAQLRALAMLCWRHVLLAAVERRPAPPTALLHAAVGVAPQGTVAGATAAATAAERALADLAGYLASGHGPGVAAPSLLLEHALGAAPTRAGLTAALTPVLTRRQAFRRLVEGMPAVLLERLAHLAAPHDAPRVLASLQQHLATAARHGAGTMDLARLASIGWERALVTLLCRHHGADDAALPVVPALAGVPAMPAAQTGTWVAAATTGPAYATPPAPVAQPATAACARARLLEFLATGRLAPTQQDATREPTAVDLLDDVLAGADAALWPALAAVLAAPAALRRLLEQFPERQWRALVRSAQPEHAEALCALAATAGGGAPEESMAWRLLVLAAVAAAGTPLAPGQLRGPAPAGALPPVSDAADGVARLAHWLRTGALPPGADAQPGALLASAIAATADPARLHAALAAALVRPAAARRLATLVPQEQLETLLWLVAPTAAASTIDAAAEVRALALARGATTARAETFAARCRQVALADLLGRDGTTAVQRRDPRHAMRAATGPSDAQAPAGQAPRSALEQLAVFLASGRLDPPQTPQATAPAHVTVLDALLAAPADALLAVLADALAHPASRRRLIEQFPDRQLLAIVALAQPGGHAASPAHLAPAVAADRHASWLALLAAALADRATEPHASHLQAPHGRVGADDAWIDELFQAPVPVLRLKVSTILSQPAMAATLVERLADSQLGRLVQMLQPGRGAQPLLDFAPPAAAGPQARARHWHALLGAALEDPGFQRPAPQPTAAVAPPGDDVPTNADGRHVGLIADDVRHFGAHVAWLDTLLAVPSAALWTTLAAALRQPGRVRRLMLQFPQRQLDALLRLAQQQAAAGHREQADALPAGPERDSAHWRQRFSAAIAAAAPMRANESEAVPDSIQSRRQSGTASDCAESGTASDSAAFADADPVRANESEAVPDSSAAAALAAPPQSGTASESSETSHEALLARLSSFLADADPTATPGPVEYVGSSPAHPPQAETGATPGAETVVCGLAAQLGTASDSAQLGTASDSIACAAAGPLRGTKSEAIPNLPDRATAAALAAPAKAGTASGSPASQPIPASPGSGPRRVAAGQVPGILRRLPAAVTPPPWHAAPADGRKARAVRDVLRAAQAGTGAPARPGKLPVHRAVATNPFHPAGRDVAQVEAACAKMLALLAERDTSLRAAAGPYGAVAAALTGSGTAAWHRLLGERDASVTNALRGLAAGPATRAALAAGLPDAMLADLVALLKPDSAPPAPPHDASPATRQRCWRAALAAAVSDRPMLPPASLPDPKTATMTPWPTSAPEEAEPLAEGDTLALPNAGMVLLAPYLPRLFGVLGLVADGRFTDAAAAERAALLLQFAVSGQPGAPEYQLPLNKLLCGLAAEAPLPLAIEITPHERAAIDSLLGAMIESWSALGRTSVDGFREAFLMRKGELLRGAEDWRLAVAPGPFDMLMDRLPWSFSLIRYPWMAQPLHVTWRRP